MAEKQRYTVSLPDHVTAEIERHALTLGATPTEYATSVLRWWYGQGCPPVTPDEEQLRRGRGVTAYNLQPEKSYYLVGDDVVQGLMLQLNVPNLFAGMAEFDEAHTFVAFDNHPTHWIVLHRWKGLPAAKDNGLFFEALPKSSTPRAKLFDRLKVEAKKMGATEKFAFSQFPARTPQPVAPAGTTARSS